MKSFQIIEIVVMTFVLFSIGWGVFLFANSSINCASDEGSIKRTIRALLIRMIGVLDKPHGSKKRLCVDYSAKD